MITMARTKATNVTLARLEVRFMPLDVQLLECAPDLRQLLLRGIAMMDGARHWGGSVQEAVNSQPFNDLPLT